MAKKRGATQAQGGSGQRTLDAKLLAYCAVASGALLAAPPAEAAVVYSGVKNLHVGGNGFFYLDLDNNGVNDVSFHAVNVYVGHYGWIEFSANNSVAVCPQLTCSYYLGCRMIPKPYRISYGQSISPALSWSAGKHGINAGFWMGGAYDGPRGPFANATGYIGARFFNNGNRHYGWIQYSGSDTYSQCATGTIIDWAYESTPNYSIQAGQTTGSGNPVPFSQFNYAISNGMVTISGYTGAGGAVVIPDTIEGMPVVGIGYDAFRGKSVITSITIPNSVKSIGGYAFGGCDGLTSITIPNSVTTIGDDAFYHCSGLTSLSIGNGVTCIGMYAFSDCTALTSVSIGSGVTSIGNGAFQYCRGLTSVTIPGSVTSLGASVFYGCKGLTSAYFYGNAPTMGSQVFQNCASGFTVYYLAGATGFTNPWYGFPTAVFSLPDADVDGIPDVSDNCPAVANPQQLDADTDGIGDVCDTTPGCGGCGQAACEAIDTDGDGIQNYVDNCPNTANPQQKDADGDGIGDVCDATPGCGGGCGQPVCEGEVDTDHDYVRDGIDNCPSVFNPNQLDANGNGTGDCCDATPGCGGEGQQVCDDFCTL